LLSIDQFVVSVFNGSLSQISVAHFRIVLLRATFVYTSIVQVGAADVNVFQHASVMITQQQ
jgi:hypothetical protein